MGKRLTERQEARKLQNMLNDLETMKQELLPDEKNKVGGKSEQEMKSMDPFQRKKHEVNTLIARIRGNVERLTELRKKAPDGRDATTIRLQTDNTSDLRAAMKAFSDMKDALIKDESKVAKGKGKLKQADIDERRRTAVLLGEELKELTNQNSNVRMVLSEQDQQLQTKVEKRREKERLEREKRKAARKGRSGKDEVDENDIKVSAAADETELAFFDKVNENIAAQDAILTEISNGLEILKGMAHDANKELTTQAAMLADVESKMDSTIAQFKTANQRLQELLDESGGMARWCPILICAVVFLALLGYIFKGNLF